MSERRVVVQIAVTAETANEYSCIYALADDGTVWFSPYRHDDGPLVWRRLPDLPQDEP